MELNVGCGNGSLTPVAARPLLAVWPPCPAAQLELLSTLSPHFLVLNMAHYFMTDPDRPELIIIFDFGGFFDFQMWLLTVQFLCVVFECILTTCFY